MKKKFDFSAEMSEVESIKTTPKNEYLAGNVVGIVAGQHKRLSVEKLPEVHFQEILLDETSRKR